MFLKHLIFAKKFFKSLIFFTFYRKNSQELGETWKRGIPIEVLPVAYRPVKIKIEEQLGGKAVLRMAENKAVSRSVLFLVFLLIF